MNAAVAYGITSAGSFLALLASWPKTRIATTFLWRHRQLPKLSRPQSFNEWVQWRKLNDRDPSLALLTDKLHAKTLVAQLVGPSLVIPTLWRGNELPIEAPWPLPFIVKANHGCNQFVVVRNDQHWQLARRSAPRWLTSSYGRWLDEWHYSAATRTLLVEPFIGPEVGLPLDYKVFVFGGRAEFVQVHLDRQSNHRWAQFDRQWQQVSADTGDTIPPPRRLDQMLVAAERIAAGRDHLRVDFYEVQGRLWFGELCLFPGSGLDRFDPPKLDQTFGRFWTQSRARKA
jgi:hypothetical protein